MSLIDRIFGRRRYDENACIRILFDRAQSLSERGAAAESLRTNQTPAATAALLKIVLDEAEDRQLREEAATSLGSIYNVIGIDHEALHKISSPYREEVLANIAAAVPNKVRDRDGAE